MLEWRLRPANEDPQLARTFLHGHVAITGSEKHEAHDPTVREGETSARILPTSLGISLGIVRDPNASKFSLYIMSHHPLFTEPRRRGILGTSQRLGVL